MNKIKEAEGHIKYYDELPDETILCKDIREFFRVKPGRTVWKKENIEPITDMYFLIYSPVSDRYYLRQTHELTNFKKLIKYITDKNLYFFIDVSDNMD
jgi:hypothetical protein